MSIISVACALLLATAAAAPASAAPAPSSLVPHAIQPTDVDAQDIILLDSEDTSRMDDLLQSLRKFKRYASEERKLFVVKAPCKEGEPRCWHSQLYEFDLLKVEPDGKDDGSVYY